MERRAKVELFGQIRKEYEFGVGTIGSGAQARGASADGAPGAGQRRATGPQAESTRAAGDRAAAALHRHHPGGRSQRAAQAAPHCTSDLRADQERATGVAEVTVRQYVRERKGQLGWSTRTTCVPQSYAPGQEGQVDWYEAWAELSGAPVKLQVFSLRSMVSGAAFHRAYHRATQQAFLEAYEQAFHYFGGVFRLFRYDT